MKFGVRNPSISKRIAARTTSKYERNFKRITNPYYGKKGSGYIKDPHKAIYNHIYNESTIDIDDLFCDKRYKILSQRKIKNEDEEYTEFKVSFNDHISFNLANDNFLKFAKLNDHYINPNGIYNEFIFEYNFPKFRKINLEVVSDNINVSVRNNYIATLSKTVSSKLIPYLKENELTTKYIEIYGGKWVKVNLHYKENDNTVIDENNNIVSYTYGEKKYQAKLTYNVIDTYNTENEKSNISKNIAIDFNNDRTQTENQQSINPNDYLDDVKSKIKIGLLIFIASIFACIYFL